MKEGLPRLITKCENFQRIRKSDRIELQICKAKGVAVSCGGWSDSCEYPELFKAVPRDEKNEARARKIFP